MTRNLLIAFLFLSFPLFGHAQTSESMDIVSALFEFGHYLSVLGFFISALLFGVAVQGLARTAFASVFTNIFLGTLVLFLIPIYLMLGPAFLGVSEESFHVWWHALFYLAFVLYFIGLRHMVSIGDSDTKLYYEVPNPGGASSVVITIGILIASFFLPRFVEGILHVYNTSMLASFGLHHFISFALAGIVATYLIFARQRFGVIGNAIAGPMTIAVSLFSIQHLWELLTESWKIIELSSLYIERVEMLFLFAASIALVVAAWRLKTFAHPSTSARTML